MSKKRHHQERRIRVRGIQRKQVDVKKLGKAVIALAVAQAEKEAQAEHRQAKQSKEQP